MINAKIARAEEHRAELAVAALAFVQSPPYEIRARRDPTSQRILHAMTRVDEVPPRLPVLLGDMLFNLRSALDNIAYHLVWVATNTKPGSEPSFPIQNSEAEYHQSRDGRACRGMTAAMLREIDACRPFKGGDDRLWKLHRLQNIDKHRTLLLAGSQVRAIDIGGHGFRMLKRYSETLPEGHPGRAVLNVPLPSIFFEVADNQFPLKIGDVVFDDRPEGDINDPMGFHFELAIGESDISYGEPLLQVAEEIVSAVLEVRDRLTPLLG